jgi:hypothetical protein
MKSMILSFLVLLSFNAISGDALETNSVLTIEKKALEKGKKFGKKNVLVVFDIDNTLMAMNQNFGADQWWGWQSSNCMKKKAPSFCVTNKFNELLDIQGQIFAVSNMKPSETTTVRVIKSLQKKGFKVILLTSRGPAFRNATERALKMNKFDFTSSAIGPKGGYASTFKPYNLKYPKKFGLTKSDLEVSGNPKPRSASYMNGLFMTSGMNKGLMLKAIMHKTGESFKAIVFADDHIKHTKRMQQILGKTKGLDLTTYRYGAIDAQVKKFKKSDKKDVIEAWNNFKMMRKGSFKL